MSPKCRSCFPSCVMYVLIGTDVRFLADAAEGHEPEDEADQELPPEEGDEPRGVDEDLVEGAPV